MPLTQKDKSISITFGINNWGFWRPSFYFRFAKEPKFFLIWLMAGWITVWISKPSLYQIYFMSQKKQDEPKSMGHTPKNNE